MEETPTIPDQEPVQPLAEPMEQGTAPDSGLPPEQIIDDEIARYDQEQDEATAAELDLDAEASESDPAAQGSFSWQASEFIHHQKQAGWYGLFAIVVVVLVIIAVLTKQWFSVAVFIAMAGALLVYAKKEPRTLNYQVGPDGVSVENKIYHYNQFKSFSVFNDVAWHSIDLDPTQRFLPRLTIIFESKDLDKLVELLSSHLPRIDRQPDIIERLTRSLKF